MTAEPCRCDVPGCRRWTRRYAPGDGYLCPDHWKLVDRKLKAFRRARWKKIGDRPDRRNRFSRAIWRRMVRQAVERWAGL